MLTANSGTELKTFNTYVKTLIWKSSNENAWWQNTLYHVSFSTFSHINEKLIVAYLEFAFFGRILWYQSICIFPPFYFVNIVQGEHWQARWGNKKYVIELLLWAQCSYFFFLSRNAVCLCRHSLETWIWLTRTVFAPPGSQTLQHRCSRTSKPQGRYWNRALFLTLRNAEGKMKSDLKAPFCTIVKCYSNFKIILTTVLVRKDNLQTPCVAFSLFM